MAGLGQHPGCEVRVAGFPYRLVYLVQPADVVVVALAHEKRKPGYWRDRLAST